MIATKFAMAVLTAATMSAQTKVVMLWPGAAPGSETWTQTETEYPQGNAGLKAVRNVTKPSLTVFLPADNPTGASVIIAPGGGFRILSWNMEGTQVAEWLQKRGVAAFVLKYRLTDTGSDEEFAEPTRAPRPPGPRQAHRAREVRDVARPPPYRRRRFGQSRPPTDCGPSR